jgi:hypothetical protein
VHVSSFLTATVHEVPTPSKPWYVIIYEYDATGKVDPTTVYGPDDPIYLPDPYEQAETLEEPVTPHWVHNNSNVTVALEGTHQQGYLMLNERFEWNFVQRDLQGQETFRFTLPNLPTT